MRPDAATASTRRAALVAHAMQPADRHWLLQSLEPDARALLDGLLQELHTLRIPAAAGLLDELTAAAAPRTPVQRLEQLSAAEAAALAGILGAEDPVLVAAVLAIRPWPWRADALAALDPSAREVAPARPAPALEQALCEALVHHLDARSSRSCAPVPAGGRWRQIFRRAG